MGDSDAISRRRLLAGAGAIGGAAVLTAGPASGAQASPPMGAAGSAVTSHPNTTPSGINSISSAPEAHTSYRFLTWTDATPLNAFSSGRSFGTNGVFTAGGSDELGVCYDLPPGALLHDVEVYYVATGTSSLNVVIWSSGAAFFSNLIASVALGPFADSNMHVTNLPIPVAVNGPFPHGCRLALYVPTPSNGTIQVNGFRLGLRDAPLSPVLLPAPVRAYDSRTNGGPLAGGSVRTVSLAGQVPVGALGALVNVTVSHTVGAGFLALYSADAVQPSTSSILWFGSGQSLANQATTAVDLTRSVKVSAGGGSTQFLIDVLGYLV